MPELTQRLDEGQGQRATVSTAATPAGKSPAATVPAVASGTRGATSFRIGLGLAIVYVFWGLTYLAMRMAIETIPPFGMAGTRYLIAGSVLFVWARLRGAASPARGHWKSAAIIGGLLLLVGNGGVVWAEQRVDSGIASLLISSEPLWITLLVWMLRRGARPGPRVFAGLLLAFGGLAVLVRPHSGGVIDGVGAAVLIAAAMSWASGSVYAQRAPQPDSRILATGMQMLCGGAWLLLASVLTGEPARFAPGAVSSRSLLALGYLIVFGALIGFTAYSWLLRVASPVLVSTYAYVNPVVAVFAGCTFAGEPLHPSTLVAAPIILAGVGLITSSPSVATRATPKDGGGGPQGGRDAADDSSRPPSVYLTGPTGKSAIADPEG